MGKIRVRSLEKYQHYSDRSPPWIKWHRCCLDDADFYDLDEGAKWLAVGLVLIASSNGNEIEENPTFLASRLGINPKKISEHLDSLESMGFIERASKVLAGCKQDASKVLALAEKSRGEKSTSVEWGEAFDSHFWPDYPRKVQKKAARRAWKKLQPSDRSKFRDRATAILETLDSRREEWNGRETDKIPHASTFLNGEEFA